jgi:hypothetical protein
VNPSITRPAGELIPELARYQTRLLAGGGAALGLVSAVGWRLEPRQFFQSYLMAYLWILGIALGSFALAMVHQLSGGAWGVVIRRAMGAASRTLPIVTLLFVPLVFGLGHLYPWTDARIVAGDPALVKKQAYLNVPFFLTRAAVYFLTWNALSHYLNAWSLRQDRTGSTDLSLKMQRLSAAGLVAYVVTISFASFDWLMSLEPHWFSTIFGVMVLGGQGLSAFAFLILALAWLARRPPMNAVATPDRFQDLGKLTLAFVMLWAYFAFSQWLIIWSGNLPDEILYYRHRLESDWMLVGVALIVFHFAVPFALLLSRGLKRAAAALAWLAGGILFMRVVDLFWLIAPDFHTTGVHVSWLDFALPLALGMFWLGLFARQLRGRAILPVHDPEFAEALDGLVAGGPAPAGSDS